MTHHPAQVSRCTFSNTRLSRESSLSIHSIVTRMNVRASERIMKIHMHLPIFGIWVDFPEIHFIHLSTDQSIISPTSFGKIQTSTHKFQNFSRFSFLRGSKEKWNSYHRDIKIKGGSTTNWIPWRGPVARNKTGNVWNATKRQDNFSLLSCQWFPKAKGLF